MIGVKILAVRGERAARMPIRPGAEGGSGVSTMLSCPMSRAGLDRAAPSKISKALALARWHDQEAAAGAQSRLDSRPGNLP